jgi:hypothetical protein
MKTIKTYSTRIEADLARIVLDAAGVPSVVVGVGAGMEGGTRGACNCSWRMIMSHRL